MELHLKRLLYSRKKSRELELCTALTLILWSQTYRNRLDNLSTYALVSMKILLLGLSLMMIWIPHSDQARSKVDFSFRAYTRYSAWRRHDLRTDRCLAFRDMMSVAKLILQLMIGALGKVIRLVGVCGTSSSIDSHKTNSFLIQLLMCLRRYY